MTDTLRFGLMMLFQKDIFESYLKGIHVYIYLHTYLSYELRSSKLALKKNQGHHCTLQGI